MEHLSIDWEDHTKKHESSHKLFDEKAHPILSLKESWWKLRLIMTWSEFPNGGTTTLKEILMPVEVNKPKRAGLWESQSGIQIGQLTIWIRLFMIEKLKQSSPGLSFPPAYVSQSLWWMLWNSSKTNTLADGLIERTSYMWDEIA